MSPIETPRLFLEIKSADSVREMLDAMPPEVRVLVAQDWVDRALSAKEPVPWLHGFSVIRRSDRQPMGFIGFKGYPSEKGEVELAYGIDDEFQNQGYATEAAAALTQFARSCPEVLLVIAHTLPVSPASQRVLTKCGFKHTGECIDPDDGLVWRWEFQG